MWSNKELVCQFLEELKSDDPGHFVQQLPADVELHVCLGNQIHSDSYAATFMGKKGVQNLFKLCNQFFKIRSITPSEFHPDGNKMIVRGDLECTLHSTGEDCTSSWMQIWTFNKGKVLKIRIFADFHIAYADTLPDLETIAKDQGLIHH